MSSYKLALTAVFTEKYIYLELKVEFYFFLMLHVVKFHVPEQRCYLILFLYLLFIL